MKRTHVGTMRRFFILLIDMIVLALLAPALIAAFTHLSTSTQLSSFFYVSALLGIAAYAYAITFIIIYKRTVGMLLLGATLRTPTRRSLAHYSLLYAGMYSIASTLIIILEIGSQIILKDTTMFEIISGARMEMTS